MACMSKLHPRRDGRSECKAALLMEIKSVTEDQIRFLEGGDDKDVVSVR